MNEYRPLIAIDSLHQEAEQRSNMIEQRTDQAMGRSGPSRMRRLLSPEARQRVRAAMARELELGFDYRRDVISMALEMRLQSFREACNQVLVDGKTRLRRQRLEYFTRTYAEVERHIDKLTGEFLDELDQRFARVERFKNPALREREKQRLEIRLDDFLRTFDRLMANFADILDEQIGHRRQHGRGMAQGAPLAGECGPVIDNESMQEELLDDPLPGDHRL